MSAHAWPALWLIVLFPLLGAAANGLLALLCAGSGSRAARRCAMAVGVAAPTLAALVAFLAWRAYAAHGPLAAPGWSWIAAGDLRLGFDLACDGLTLAMLSFILPVGALIHLYSTGYMADDPGLPRFLAYLNLFMAAMLVLVLGDSLVSCFVGWEGVGLCSYLLIGFWHREAANVTAADKAFLVNRVGDLFFLLGAFLLWSAMGGVADLRFASIDAWAGTLGHIELPAPAALGALFVFIGCCGKSAQFPLHVWLPDAMAGPTPVSALIHAATMVTSGVYLVARLHPLYDIAPGVSGIILATGAFTALLAALVATAQDDIKKVLAWSTVSQLGWMFMACGAGASAVGLFHVFTHASFKAVLFLGAGAVIHALGGEQDIRRMGGLARRLPLTALAFGAGWLAICGLPPFAGFFSKDMILETLHARGGAVATCAFWLGLLGAFLTAWYMSRLFALVFLGPDRTGEAGRHLHAPGWRMGLPLLVLGAASVAAGWAWTPWHDDFGALLGVASAGGHAAWGLMILSTVIAALGLAAGIGMHLDGPRGAGPAAFSRAFWIDEVILGAVVRPILGVARGAVDRLGEGFVFRALVLEAPAALLRGLGGAVRLLHVALGARSALAAAALGAVLVLLALLGYLG